jgi:hypothetical protein
MKTEKEEKTGRNWKVVAGVAAATGAATVSTVIGVVLYAMWSWFRNPIF